MIQDGYGLLLSMGDGEMEGNGLSIVEKGITSIEPGFLVIMYALVKRKQGDYLQWKFRNYRKNIWFEN